MATTCLHRLPNLSNICAICDTAVPGPDRLAARLRGRYADKQPHQHTLPPGQHTLTLVRGNDVSEVDVIIRPRTEADNLPPDASFVVEVVAVRGSTILPVGHVEAVRMSVDSVVVDSNNTTSDGDTTCN